MSLLQRLRLCLTLASAEVIWKRADEAARRLYHLVVFEASGLNDLYLGPDADEQTRNILNEALTGLRKAGSKLRVLDDT